MKAKCTCGKATSIDEAMLEPGEQAMHFDCVPDEPVDRERMTTLLKRAGIRPRPEDDGPGQGGRPRGGKLTIRDDADARAA